MFENEIVSSDYRLVSGIQIMRLVSGIQKAIVAIDDVFAQYLS